MEQECRLEIEERVAVIEQKSNQPSMEHSGVDIQNLQNTIRSHEMRAVRAEDAASLLADRVQKLEVLCSSLQEEVARYEFPYEQ